MKSIQTSHELESTSYRCLFEGIKENGVETFLGLVQDMHNISRKETLIKQTLFSSTNDLVRFKRNHREIIKYFKSHKKEFVRFSVTDENVLNTLNILKCILNNSSLLNLYLENARKLEDLKVLAIEFKNFQNLCNNDENYCSIYRDKQGKIINITKYYTDGQIVSDGQEILVDRRFNHSRIPFSIDLKKRMTFVLESVNLENLEQYRKITIENFGFDSTKLPSEEELQSYEIPQEYVRKRMK